MALTNKQIAEAFNVTPSRAAALVRLGCPLTSLEEAHAWREARLLRGKRGGIEVRAPISVDPSTIAPATDFDEAVNRHRSMIETARRTFEVARDAGDPSSPKLYNTYEDMLTSLVKLEREALARRIDAKELIKTSLALDRFSAILAEIKADCLSLGMEVATSANPDNPGTALKAVDDKVQKLLAKWSRTEAETKAEVGGEVPSIGDNANEELDA